MSFLGDIESSDIHFCNIKVMNIIKNVHSDLLTFEEEILPFIVNN